MADYLEEAAEQLRRVRDKNEELAAIPGYASAVESKRLVLAAAFTRLAAIERGLLPPDAEPEGEQ